MCISLSAVHSNLGAFTVFLILFFLVSPDATMAAKFTISDSESEASEEVEEGENNQSSSGPEQQVLQRNRLTAPELRMGRQPQRIVGKGGLKKCRV